MNGNTKIKRIEQVIGKEGLMNQGWRWLSDQSNTMVMVAAGRYQLQQVPIHWARSGRASSGLQTLDVTLAQNCVPPDKPPVSVLPSQCY
ncbi:hypothetical protein KQX54_019650 [Cotesia glomerata]|uniref:Uncharacterized protein n=1 Tax=Cotesia glomerata TaxID=32391 RepID=A0AAV7JA58_COTGL|nr:hypothetical protein KQX54_019650 [Cotesia glomerata]